MKIKNDLQKDNKKCHNKKPELYPNIEGRIIWVPSKMPQMMEKLYPKDTLSKGVKFI